MNSHARDLIQPLFLSGRAGRIFALYRSPPANEALKGAFLYIPPFAEEMNKARRQAHLHSARLASLGYASLSIDLFGTGDSEGDFVDARWDIWIDDLIVAQRWLARQGWEQISVCGLRLGVILAVNLFRALDRDTINHFLFWQPVLSGNQYLTQFLRLRTAADMMSGGKKVTTNQLRERFEQGKALEVAGYELHPELFAEIDQQQLRGFSAAAFPRVNWVEIASKSGKAIGHASQQVIDEWRAEGVTIQGHVVEGAPFWTTPEIATAPALIELSAAILDSVTE